MIDIYTTLRGEGVRLTHDAAELPKLIGEPGRITWIDLDGPAPEETSILNDVFHFHPLVIEDCLHRSGLPKIDVFEDYLFLVVHGILLDRKKRDFGTSEVDIFLGRNYLITHHTEPVRSIRSTKDLLSKSETVLGRGPDFLLYTILDLLVDNYQPILDEIEEIVESIEVRILKDAQEEVLQEIIAFKRTLQRMRRISAYQKEILNRFSREDFSVIDPKLHVYFRDVLDHLVRVTDLADSYKEILASALEAYLSVVSNRLNEVMKVLTIFSTILLPLATISSILGMNLEFPFHANVHAFRVTVAVMIFIIGGLLLYFRRRRWL